MKKIEYLEGLRGTAALVVFFTHFLQLFYPAMIYDDISLSPSSIENMLSKSIFNVFYNGSLAVSIFFVLSGYVLSIKFLKNNDYEVLYSSAARRYFRLGIPSAFSILIGFILLKGNMFYYGEIVDQTNGYFNNHYSSDSSIFEMIKQFLGMYFISFSKESSLNPVLWTMKYELLGSFFIFALMAIFSVFGKRLYVITSYVLIILVLFSLNYGYFGAFVLGLLISEIENSKYKGIFRESKWSYLILLTGIYFGSYPYLNIDGSIYGILSYLPFNSVFYHVVGAFLIIVSFQKLKTLQEIFSKQVFVFLGKISFSLYLLHYMLLFSFSSWLFNELSKNYSYNTSSLITFLLSTILLFIVSTLMFKYIDVQSVKISSKIYAFSFKKIYYSVFKNIRADSKINNRNHFY